MAGRYTMPDRYPPEDPREWMNRAYSNLTLAAKGTNSGVYLEDLCYNAQQAVEKAIKAIFILHHITFPYIHDIAALITLLQNNNINVPESVKESAKLTRFAIATRYPYILAPVTEHEYKRAIGIAEDVVRWAMEEIHIKKDGMH